VVAEVEQGFGCGQDETRGVGVIAIGDRGFGHRTQAFETGGGGELLEAGGHEALG